MAERPFGVYTESDLKAREIGSYDGNGHPLESLVLARLLEPARATVSLGPSAGIVFKAIDTHLSTAGVDDRCAVLVREVVKFY